MTDVAYRITRCTTKRLRPKWYTVPSASSNLKGHIELGLYNMRIHVLYSSEVCYKIHENMTSVDEHEVKARFEKHISITSTADSDTSWRAVTQNP